MFDTCNSIFGDILDEVLFVGRKIECFWPLSGHAFHMARGKALPLTDCWQTAIRPIGRVKTSLGRVLDRMLSECFLTSALLALRSDCFNACGTE